MTRPDEDWVNGKTVGHAAGLSSRTQFSPVYPILKARTYAENTHCLRNGAVLAACSLFPVLFPLGTRDGCLPSSRSGFVR